MKIQVETHDSSVEIRSTVARKKTSEMELYLYLPPEMFLRERGFDASSFLGLKTSRYYYSVSKVKLPLLKQRSSKAEADVDFPLFLKTFKLKLSRKAQEARSLTDIENFISQASTLLETLRSVPTDDRNNQEYRTADELCSYYAAQIAYVCAESVQQRDPSINLDSIIEFAANENLHRAQNYGKKNNEAQHVRRKEDLFCRTINIRRDNKKLTVLREHIAFSISAFISMLLTTLVVFYFQAGYGTFSFAVFTALCVSYIFKDRFKEIFRVYVAKRLNRGRFRVRATLTDADKRVVGRCYDMAEFVDPDHQISAVRSLGKFTKRDNEESVILYKKRYEISSELKPGFSKIGDTMEIKLQTLLQILPDISLRHMKYENGEFMKSDYEMLYDINMIIRLNSKRVYRYRLKVSHQSIRRIEEVKLPDKGKIKHETTAT